LGFQYVIFETNSKILSDAILQKKEDISEFGSIVTEINRLLSLNSNFVVKFIRRQTNMVAHSLARAAISYDSLQYFDFLPFCINDLVINEMS